MTIALCNVSRSVSGITHIAEASLELAPGSVNVLLGPTLSGKTSLMRLLAGLDVPTSGQVLVDGRDVTGVHVRTRSVAMVYQQFINYPTLTVFENIASPLRVKGLGQADIEAKVAAAARLLRLEPYLARRPLELSGGQQQRTAIARALVKDADLILLDEPLANLDYKLREELREELPRVFESAGAVLVYATTEPSEALLLGGNTICLREGRIVQIGSTIDVYSNPQSRYAAEVFSDPPLNTIEIAIDLGQVTFPFGDKRAASGLLAGLSDGTYGIAFRAHELFLEPAATPNILRFKARVLLSELTGSETFVHLETGDRAFVAVIPGVQDLAPGAELTAGIDLARVFVFDAAGQRVRARLPAQEAI
ncbi:MAG: ABC transporter ATP-binding protein [Hyphomicrobiales bacterium]|nr:MAG: ABC transporter ATP-binding protein [Hyphomicrobiales bacterium]